MRGILESLWPFGFSVRITPAHAGNTLFVIYHATETTFAVPCPARPVFQSIISSYLDDFAPRLKKDAKHNHFFQV